MRSVCVHVVGKRGARAGRSPRPLFHLSAAPPSPSHLAAKTATTGTRETCVYTGHKGAQSSETGKTGSAPASPGHWHASRSCGGGKRVCAARLLISDLGRVCATRACAPACCSVRTCRAHREARTRRSCKSHAALRPFRQLREEKTCLLRSRRGRPARGAARAAGGAGGVKPGKESPAWQAGRPSHPLLLSRSAAPDARRVVRGMQANRTLTYLLPDGTGHAPSSPARMLRVCGVGSGRVGSNTMYTGGDARAPSRHARPPATAAPRLRRRDAWTERACRPSARRAPTSVETALVREKSRPRRQQRGAARARGGAGGVKPEMEPSACRSAGRRAAAPAPSPPYRRRGSSLRRAGCAHTKTS